MRRHPFATGTALLLALATTAPAQQGPKLPPGVKAVREREYVQGGHERNKLDLYLPEKAGGPLPVIVCVHGGGWQGGSKDSGLAAVGFVAKRYAVASINYRLSQHAKFPAQIEDCKAALRWLRANAKKYNLDADHFGAFGSSAGGHLVALLGTTAGVKELEGKGGSAEQSSRVQAVVDWFGPTDLTTIAKQAGPDGKFDHNSAKSAESLLIGGPLPENKEQAARASPVTYVTKEAAPFLILHGDKDPVVPYAQSEELAEALKKAGAEVTLKKVEGAGHGGAAFNSAENRKLVEDFFDKHLKKTKK